MAICAASLEDALPFDAIVPDPLIFRILFGSLWLSGVRLLLPLDTTDRFEGAGGSSEV